MFILLFVFRGVGGGRVSATLSAMTGWGGNLKISHHFFSAGLISFLGLVALLLPSARTFLF